MYAIRSYYDQLPQNIARMLYVKRYWQVAYTGSGWTADITFPYSDQEASMITDKSQLRSVRQAVPLGPVITSYSIHYTKLYERSDHIFAD